MRLILTLMLFLNLAVAQKLALVIGNSNYNQGYLPNPTKDADLIAQKLESVGFSVTPVHNIGSASEMKKVINNFARKLNREDIAVVYYAGHGVQCLGKNYLMPTQANVVKGGQLSSEAVDLNFLIGGLSEIKLAIVMLDACRNNTYPSCSKSQTRGLVQPTVANDGGMIISFATAENDIALDGNGDHSPYALALSKFMNQSLPIETYFREVGGEVFSSSGQRPMLKNSFYGRFSFGGDVLVSLEPFKDIVAIDSLMYQNQPFRKMYTWERAKEYCQDLGFGGYDDWKLPTINELSKISTIDIPKEFLDIDYRSSFKNEIFRDKYKNRLNQNDYKESFFIKKEFVKNLLIGAFFWTSESSSKYTNNKQKKFKNNHILISFHHGLYGHGGISAENHVLCVRKK